MKKSCADLIIYNLGVSICLLLITSDWVKAALGLVLGGICSFLIYKKRTKFDEINIIKKASDQFICSYFALIEGGVLPKQAYQQSAISLPTSLSKRSFEEIKGNRSSLDQLSLGVYKSAIFESFDGKKTGVKCELLKKSSFHETDTSSIEKEILFSSVIFFLLFTILKMLFGTGIADYSNVYFGWSLVALDVLIPALLIIAR